MQTKDAQIWGCISFMASPRSGGLHFCSGRFLLPSHDALFSARRRQKGVRWRRRHWRRRLLRSAKNAGSKFQLLLLDQRSKERDSEQDEKFLNSALIVEADLKFKEKKCASLGRTKTDWAGGGLLLNFGNQLKITSKSLPRKKSTLSAATASAAVKSGCKKARAKRQATFTLDRVGKISKTEPKTVNKDQLIG